MLQAFCIVLVCAACNDKHAPQPAPPSETPPPTTPKGTPQPPSPVEEIALGMSAAVVRLADGSTWTFM